MAELNSSIKTPLITVYDIAGNPLASSFGDMDIDVVTLRYKYDDADDDICTIKLQMAEPKHLDLLNIKRGTFLQIVWGYLNNPLSPTATVVVRDMVSKYGNNIIYTELECTDFLTYLKVVRSPDVGKGTITSFIKAQVYGKYNIMVKDRGEILYVQAKRKEDQKRDRLVELYVDDTGLPSNFPFYQPLDEVSEKYGEVPEGTGVVLKKAVISPVGTWRCKTDHPVYQYMEKETDIPTSNRSTYVVLQDLFKKCPRGPWFIAGRGDTLVIHNRNLGRKVYREYKYKAEPGYLIDFQAKTKFENFERQVISYAGMDPKNRENFFLDDYRIALSNLRNPKEILSDKNITEEEKKKQIKEYISIRFEGYARFGIGATPGAILNPFDEDRLFIPGHFSKGFINKVGQTPYAVQDNTEVLKNSDPFIRDEGERFNPLEHDVILRAQWFTMPLLTWEDAVSVTNNRQRELAMDKEEAKIILEGDPWLMDKHTIRITNVHSQHEGHYYVKKCEHMLTQQGYKTTLDCIKVVPEAMVMTLGNITKEEYDNLDGITKETFDKQYQREQKLFGNNLKVVGSEFVRKYYPGSQPVSTITPYDEYREASLSITDLLDPEQNWQVDDFVDRMLEIYNSKDARFELNSINPENK